MKVGEKLLSMYVKVMLLARQHVTKAARKLTRRSKKQTTINDNFLAVQVTD
jgi:hypothetical protein